MPAENAETMMTMFSFPPLSRDVRNMPDRIARAIRRPDNAPAAIRDAPSVKWSILPEAQSKLSFPVLAMTDSRAPAAPAHAESVSHSVPGPNAAENGFRQIHEQTARAPNTEAANALESRYQSRDFSWLRAR